MDPETQAGPSPDTTRDDVLAVLGDLTAGNDADDLVEDPKPDRARDERGRFAPGQSQPPTALNGAAQGRRGPGTQPTPEGAEPQAEPQPAAAAAAPAQAAPRWWKADAHGDYAKLPPQAQTAIADRDAAFQKWASDKGRELKAWEPIQQALSTPEFQARGVNPQAYLGDLVKVESSLVKDINDSRADGAVYLDTLEWLAQQYYGKTLAELLDMRDAEQAAPAAPANGANGHAIDLRKDPVFQAMAAKIQQLESGVSAQEQARQAEIEAQTTARRAAIKAEFEEFAKDKPLARDPAVILTMQQLLASGAAKNFPEAYEKASWLHPPARDALLKQQSRAATERARAAAISPQAGAPSPGIARTGSSRESHEESVRAVLDEMRN